MAAPVADSERVLAQHHVHVPFILMATEYFTVRVAAARPKALPMPAAPLRVGGGWASHRQAAACRCHPESYKDQRLNRTNITPCDSPVRPRPWPAHRVRRRRL